MSIKVRLNPNNKQLTKLFQYAGCFRDDYSIYIEDENKNLLFDYHYYMDQDRDEFHCFMNKDIITEDFYKQLQENKLLRGDIQYNEILDFNFKKDFAKLNENEKRTDLYECNSKSERNGGNKTRESEFMFKANGDVYFAKIKDTPNLDSKFLDLYKYNEKNETLENVLSYGQKHDYKEDKTVRFVMDGNSKEFSKELFVEIGMKFDINLFNENLFKNANDIEVVYDEKSNRDCDLCGIKYDGKEYSLTNFHNKEKHEIKIAKFCYDGVICTIHSRFINLSESTFVHEVNIIGENKKEIFTYRKKFGTIFDEPIYYFDENVVTEDFMKLLYADNKTKDVLTKYFSLYDVNYETMLERNQNTILKKKS